MMSQNSSVICPNSSTVYIDVLSVCTYSFIFIMGLIFNLIALVFFFRQTKARSHTVVYMTNLALADILLVLTLPVRICFHLGFLNPPSWLCDTLGLILKANMYGSIFLLTCICFDRCMAVRFPMSARIQEGRKKAPLVCLGIWMLTFGASLPVYFSKKPTKSHCFDSQPVYAIEVAVVIPTLVLGFGIPLVVMLISSWGLVRAIRESTVAKTNFVDSRKIQKMVATSILVFLLSFLPYHATLVLLSLHKEHITCPMLTAYQYSLMVACFNTVLDPITYYFTTDTFRRKVGITAVQNMLPLNSQSSEVNSRSRMPKDS